MKALLQIADEEKQQTCEYFNKITLNRSRCPWQVRDTQLVHKLVEKIDDINNATDNTLKIEGCNPYSKQ